MHLYLKIGKISLLLERSDTVGALFLLRKEAQGEVEAQNMTQRLSAWYHHKYHRFTHNFHWHICHY